MGLYFLAGELGALNYHIVTPKRFAGRCSEHLVEHTPWSNLVATNWAFAISGLALNLFALRLAYDEKMVVVDLKMCSTYTA